MSAPESSIGLVLRTRPLTESSLIVHWLTPNFGRLATVAKGARRPKSPFLGKIDLFFLAEFIFHRSRRSELHTLRELKLLETNPTLRTDLGYLRQAAYGANLIEQTTESETPLPEVFDLARAFLSALPRSKARPQSVLAFELKLLKLLGLQPDPGHVRLDESARQVMRELRERAFEEIGTLACSGEDLRQLRQFLHGYLIYHLGRLARGRETALSDNPGA